MRLKLVHSRSARPITRPAMSPLVVSDRLISLAIDADRAGMDLTAGQLLELACAVLESPPSSSR